MLNIYLNLKKKTSKSFKICLIKSKLKKRKLWNLTTKKKMANRKYEIDGLETIVDGYLNDGYQNKDFTVFEVWT